MLKKEMEKRIAELEAESLKKDEEIRLMRCDRHNAKEFAAKANNVRIAVEVFMETNFPIIKKNDKGKWDNVVIVEAVENPLDRNYLMMKHLLKLLYD